MPRGKQVNCALLGTVKRVVLTSSLAAIFWDDLKHPPHERHGVHVYTEEDWTDTEGFFFKGDRLCIWQLIGGRATRK